MLIVFHATLVLAQGELLLRGAGGLYSQLQFLADVRDWERVAMLSLAVAMKVRNERESAALVVALGALAIAAARMEEDEHKALRS
jgi:hypothetical protein